MTIKEIMSTLELDKSKTQTIRNYSDKFNIGTKDPSSGYRLYSSEDVEKLKNLIFKKNKPQPAPKDPEEKSVVISESNSNNEGSENQDSNSQTFEPSKNEMDLMALRSIIKDEIEGFVNLSRTAIMTAQEVGKLRAINEFQVQEIEKLKEQFNDQKTIIETLEDEKNKVLSIKEKELQEQKNKLFSLEEEKKQILFQKEKELFEQKNRFDRLDEDKKRLQKNKEEEIQRLEREKNSKLLEQEKLLREQEEKAKLLEAEKKALEEQNKLKEKKKLEILKELETLEGKWFVGTKRKELFKQLQDLG